MADIKTNLRELSVAYGLWHFFQTKRPNISTVSISDFWKVCKMMISNDIEKAANVLNLKTFNEEQKKILSNGISLAYSIIEKLAIDKIPKVQRYGFDSQKADPIDIKINWNWFSLKEDSFILENMGLYKLINLLTNQDRGRGAHIFKMFANEEYASRFWYARTKLVETVSSNWPWSKEHKGALIKIKKKENNIILSRGEVSSSVPVDATLDVFETQTTSDTREQVFSKRIKENLSTDIWYLTAKKKCSETAWKNLVDYVNKNMDVTNNNLLRFLQIYPNEYYYAKTTANWVKIYKVPWKEDFTEDIVVKKLIYVVPDSQLNIFTEIMNKKTRNSLLLRNELRFSHWQFNWTPEAKMYYGRGNSLEAIYFPL